ncbi:hypothetical protein EDB89DRAFT_1912443 [Lactarius sanguifluus]|nr:hypothetical protein EDB89DRAFT_1912443 [Lactarius sanguifluus]
MPPALSLHPVAVAYWHRFRVTALPPLSLLVSSRTTVAIAVVSRCRRGPLSSWAVVVFVVVVMFDLPCHRQFAVVSSWSWSTYCRWSAGGGLLSLYGWPAIVVVQAHTKVVVVVQLTDDAELPTPGDCQFRKCGPARRLGQATSLVTYHHQQQQVSVSDDNDATTTTERRQSTMARSMPNDGAMPAQQDGGGNDRHLWKTRR